MNFDVEKYVIDEKASVKSALLKVDKNSFGLIFTQTNAGKITGLATDGDIRRALIRGVTLEELKHQTGYFGITLEFLIVGNYGEYVEEFSYSFPEEAVRMFNSSRH